MTPLLSASPVARAIFWCFGAYTLLIILFAFLYFGFYSWQPSRFTSSSDIRRRRLAERRLRARAELRSLRPFFTALQNVEGQLSADHPMPPARDDSLAFSLPGGDVFRIVYFPPEESHDLPVFAPAYYEFYLATALSRVVASRTIEPSADFFSDRQALLTQVQQLIVAIRMDLQRQERIRRSPSAFRPWTLLDFLYFSLITQSTVGYGDILPNSTGVRMLVCSQIFTGYFILVVVLNLILVAR